METLYNFFNIISGLTFFVLLVGLIRPSFFVPGKKRTRGRVLLYYGIGFFVLFSLGQAVKPEELKKKEAQAAQEHLKEGKHLFFVARWAYSFQAYQRAKDSADAAANTLRHAKDSLPEAALLADSVSAFIDTVKVALKQQQDSVKIALKQQKEDAKYTTQRGTLARLVEKHAHQVFGVTVEQDGEELPKIISVSAGYMADVAYRVGPIWSVGTLRSSLMRNTRHFMKRVFTDPECSTVGTVMVRPHNILVDKYGQNNEDQVAKLLLRREVASRINWDNLSDDMFERLLETEGQLWLHGSFYR